METLTKEKAFIGIQRAFIGKGMDIISNPRRPAILQMQKLISVKTTLDYRQDRALTLPALLASNTGIIMGHLEPEPGSLKMKAHLTITAAT